MKVFQPKLVILLLLALAMCGAGTTDAGTTSQSRNDAGYVLEVEGNWYLQRQPRNYLVKGQRLAAGDVIRILAPTASDHIVISNPRGELTRRYCNNRSECSRRLVVTAPTETEPSFFEVILQTTMRLIRTRPNRYSAHGVRGEVNNLEEAVCRFDKGFLDLSPVFRAMPKGVYYVKLRQPQVAKPSSEPLRFDWDPQRVSLLPVNNLTRGIHELRLFVRTGDQYESTPLAVWILTSSPSDFDRTNDQFRKGVSLTGKWGKTITDETRREILRAYLDDLATGR